MTHDGLSTLNPFLILLKASFESMYMPSLLTTIDEIMVPLRGQLPFRQHVPGKSHKYAVKLYNVTDINGYKLIATLHLLAIIF